MSEKVPSAMLAQQILRSALAFMPSDQNLHWLHFGKQRMQNYFILVMKTLITRKRFAG